MTTVMIIHSWMNGVQCPHAGQYLETFDHEAFDGRGYGTFTPDIKKAMKFPSKTEAWEFWRKIPKCKRRREDGEPNRPLTAATIQLIDVREKEFQP